MIKNEFYYNNIPIGEENAVTYEELMDRWKVNKRQVRKILHDISLYDNGDNYIIIRSGHGKGFYKTDDVKKMQAYKYECLHKGKSIFSAIKKINRIANVEDKQYNIFNNLKAVRLSKGLSQPEVCKLMLQYDQAFDVPLLSKLENGVVIPPPFILTKLAKIYGVKTTDLIMIQQQFLDIYCEV